MDAAEAQIGNIVGATMLPPDDVIDLMGED
jgi:hypothetical protein